MDLIAYEIANTVGWTLSQASYQRQWMEETTNRGAYRCLPLSMANQAGWFVHAPVSFSAVWNGSLGAEGAIQFAFGGDAVRGAETVISHFGSGVVTFRIPFLFRTPPGIGLLVRGAPNWPKANFFALEGLVETEWNAATFTMNWKIIEPNVSVHFDVTDPVCFLQPFDLNLPEKLSAKRSNIYDDPVAKENFTKWRESRMVFLKNYAERDGDWQKDYFQGLDASGQKVLTHRTAYRLSDFRPTKEEK